MNLSCNLLNLKYILWGNNKFINRGCAKFKKDIIGSNNIVEVSIDSVIHSAQILIRGNNNKIYFGERVYCGPRCSFRIEANNASIFVGSSTTFTRDVQLCVQEDEMNISLGKDCMLSNNIIIRTSDSHPIFNELGERINHANSVQIGDHVWIAPNSKIMKGVLIGNGTIVGSNTMVTKQLPSNVLAVGAPAKVIKENVRWTREKLY